MKYCINSSKCAWGSASTPNTCAYYINKTDYECPLIWENYEVNIDKLCGGSIQDPIDEDSADN